MKFFRTAAVLSLIHSAIIPHARAERNEPSLPIHSVGAVVGLLSANESRYGVSVEQGISNRASAGISISRLAYDQNRSVYSPKYRTTIGATFWYFPVDEERAWNPLMFLGMISDKVQSYSRPDYLIDLDAGLGIEWIPVTPIGIRLGVTTKNRFALRLAWRF